MKFRTLGLLLLVSCAQNNDPKTSEYWLKRLDNTNERAAALRMLGQMGDKTSTKAIVSWLKQEGPWQPEAANALAALGDKAAVPDLIAVLDYTAPENARIKIRTNVNAVRALTVLKAIEASPNIIQLLKESPVPSVREAAILSLGELQQFQATPALLEVVQHENQPYLRKLAIVALGKIRDPQAVENLVDMLYVEMPGIGFYNEAKQALVQIGQPAIPKLLETLKRENKNVENLRLQDGNPIAEGAIEAKASAVLGELHAREATLMITRALEKLYLRYQTSRNTPVYASVPAGVVEMSYALSLLPAETQSVALLQKIAKDDNSRIQQAAKEALAILKG